MARLARGLDQHGDHPAWYAPGGERGLSSVRPFFEVHPDLVQIIMPFNSHHKP